MSSKTNLRKRSWASWSPSRPSFTGGCAEIEVAPGRALRAANLESTGPDQPARVILT